MKLFEKNAAELSAMLQNKECSAVELTKMSWTESTPRNLR